MSGEIEHLGDVEHLLHRPDTIVGSTTPEETVSHIFIPKGGNAGASGEAPKPKKFVPISDSFGVEWRTLQLAPALISVIMEIATNAIDRQFVDSTVSKIDVWVDCEEAGGQGWIRIRNDGLGIPVIMDDTHELWKPSMAFGLFRTGSNFQDAAGPRFTGGRNGYGCKATNAFSTEFKVHTGDAISHKQFQQTYRNNMSEVEEPQITTYRPKKGFTDVSFKLDFPRFGIEGMDATTKAVIEAAIIDASACSLKNTKMTLNGTPLGVRNLRDYTSMFTTQDVSAYDSVKDPHTEMVMLEVCAVPLLPGAEESQFGFVNSLRCSTGTHMNLAFSKIAEVVQVYIKKQFKKDVTVTTKMVQRELFVCVRAMVDSPQFDSQTKEKLTTARARLGFQWTPSVAFTKAIANTGVARRIYDKLSSKEESAASSTTRGSRVVTIDKYEGAINARRAGTHCSLFVTEGDSAMALVMSGLSVVGREDFGVFPLKGKLLNVRNCKVSKLMENHEIVSMMKILGLEYGKTYTSLDSLRYKELVIFSDQDPDGSHIAGLILNFIHALFPSVLVLDPTYVKRFVTPIVRCTHKRTKVEQCFFSLPAFHEWEVSQGDDLRQYSMKYYKGLGTSTAAQGKQYFAAYDDHMIDLRWGGEASDTMMEKFFAQTESSGQNGGAARRELIENHYDPNACVDYAMEEVPFETFLTNEVLDFGNHSNIRAIPSVVDGFKPGQRKSVWDMLFKMVMEGIRVSQAAAMVALDMSYENGEVSMVETIVKIAQEYANNVSLFVPIGQFGSRNNPRSVHAAARYIYTSLMPVARSLFMSADDAVLDFVVHEGETVEPTYLVGVVATALLNGCNGIGWGWRTYVPSYNPRDLVSVARRWVEGGDQAVMAGPPLVPWYADFTGSVVKVDGEYKATGVWRVEGNTVHITELPPGTWTKPYMEKLTECYLAGREPKKKNTKRVKYGAFIRLIDNLSTDSTVHLVLQCDPALLATVEPHLGEILMMTTAIPTDQMFLFDKDGSLHKYDSPEEIVCAHSQIRLDLYTKRKAHQLAVLRRDLMVARNKHRFVTEVDDELVVRRREEADVVAEMDSRGYDRLEDSFDYLLGMSFKSRTVARLTKLENQIGSLEMQVTALEKSTERELWLADLDLLEEGLEQYYRERAVRFADVEVPEGGGGGGKKRRRGGGKKSSKRAKVG